MCSAGGPVGLRMALGSCPRSNGATLTETGRHAASRAPGASGSRDPSRTVFLNQTGIYVFPRCARSLTRVPSGLQHRRRPTRSSWRNLATGSSCSPSSGHTVRASYILAPLAATLPLKLGSEAEGALAVACSACSRISAGSGSAASFCCPVRTRPQVVSLISIPQALCSRVCI